MALWRADYCPVFRLSDFENPDEAPGGLETDSAGEVNDPTLEVILRLGAHRAWNQFPEFATAQPGCSMWRPSQ